jgi:hypothetical protein
MTGLGRVRFSPDASLWRRSTTMALMFGVGFGMFDVLILGSALFGGRYQSCSKSGHDICDMYLLAVTYPIGAAAMGAIFGACYPLCRRLWLAVLVGSVAMVPWFAGIAVTNVKTEARWTESDSWLVGICSVLMGAALGYAAWKRIRVAATAAPPSRARRPSRGLGVTSVDDVGR